MEPKIKSAKDAEMFSYGFRTGLMEGSKHNTPSKETQDYIDGLRDVVIEARDSVISPLISYRYMVWAVGVMVFLNLSTIAWMTVVFTSAPDKIVAQLSQYELLIVE
jgi:hypothetical protein